MTQNSTWDTNQYLRHQATSGSHSWYRQCLRLAHDARNIGAKYPTAKSAMDNTPNKYRVYDSNKVSRGMVMYFDNPTDSNPAGHIVTVQGRDSAGHLLVWSNDVAGPGRVSLVHASFFPSVWRAPFRFAATWLNGVVLDMPAAWDRNH